MQIQIQNVSYKLILAKYLNFGKVHPRHTQITITKHEDHKHFLVDRAESTQDTNRGRIASLNIDTLKSQTM